MQSFKQILIIVLASIIVMALFMPLAQTEWVESMRSGFGTEGESMGDESGEDPRVPGDMPAALGIIMGFIKEIVIMGVCMLITLGVLRIVRRRTRSKLSPNKRVSVL